MALVTELSGKFALEVERQPKRMWTAIQSVAK